MNKKKIVKKTSIQAQSHDLVLPEVQKFEVAITELLRYTGLPHEKIFVAVGERTNAFRNLSHVIQLVDGGQKQDAIYLSKFIAAVGSGLFDAALNYLWDETVAQLRRRIAQYDLSYFYDQAIGTNVDKRQRLQDETDLVKLDDAELITGARNIELISEIGYKHLDYIRYMRNWASAAHPNQNEITGLQLISWLETCIKEVISLPLSTTAIEIKKLLTNIRTTPITPDSAKSIGAFMKHLSSEQIHNLASGFFGIFTRPDSPPTAVSNVPLLLPYIKDIVDNSFKDNLGIKYGHFAANNAEPQRSQARSFLEALDALDFLPKEIKLAEIDTALENLLQVHHALNNFYNESIVAGSLRLLVSDSSKIPKMIKKKYTLTLMNVALTNGNGAAWDAEQIYLELIDSFDQNMAIMALFAFDDPAIQSKLQFRLCQKKYFMIADRLRPKITDRTLDKLIKLIGKYRENPKNLHLDSEIRKYRDTLKKIWQ